MDYLGVWTFPNTYYSGLANDWPLGWNLEVKIKQVNTYGNKDEKLYFLAIL